MTNKKIKKKYRHENELQSIKMILDENVELKKKVLKFMMKMLGKTSSVTEKNKRSNK